MLLNDKSFQALIFSIVLHGIMVLFIRTYSGAPISLSQNEPTEVEFIDEGESKKQTVVTETDKADLLEKFKTQADFLSQFTKRVKEQIKARNSGETKNSPSTGPRQNADQQKMEQQASKPLQEPGETQRKSESPLGRNIVMGESSIAERIPGVREGAFTALNTDQFTYYTFYARMNEQVRYRWIRQIRSFVDSLSQQDFLELAKKERVTRIEVILDSTGNLLNSIVHFTSGYQPLDQAAAHAFADAAPFRNPPRGMVEADGKIHLFYEFYVTLNPNAVM